MTTVFGVPFYRREYSCSPSTLECFVILAGEANSLQRVVASWSVVAVADPYFPSAWTLRFIVGGIRSADRGSVASAASGRARDRRLRSSSGCDAGAGVFAGLHFRHSVVRRHVLLDLRHHARAWRAERTGGRSGAISLLPLSRSLSRTVWTPAGIGGRTEAR